VFGLNQAAIGKRLQLKCLKVGFFAKQFYPKTPKPFSEQQALLKFLSTKDSLLNFSFEL